MCVVTTVVVVVASADATTNTTTNFVVVVCAAAATTTTAAFHWYMWWHVKSQKLTTITKHQFHQTRWTTSDECQLITMIVVVVLTLATI
jgi:hypothetical protein